MITFRRDEDGYFPEFLAYLKDLPRGSSAISCEHLRVLPEQVKLSSPNYHDDKKSKAYWVGSGERSIEYGIGTWICLEGARLELHKTCGIADSQIKIKEEGRAIVDCRQHMKKLEIRILTSTATSEKERKNPYSKNHK